MYIFPVQKSSDLSLWSVSSFWTQTEWLIFGAGAHVVSNRVTFIWKELSVAFLLVSQLSFHSPSKALGGPQVAFSLLIMGPIGESFSRWSHVLTFPWPHWGLEPNFAESLSICFYLQFPDCMETWGDRTFLHGSILMHSADSSLSQLPPMQ